MLREEENYNTVLDRIFIRAYVDGKWSSISLRDALKEEDQLIAWINHYLSKFGIGLKVRHKGEITEEKLIKLIQAFDDFGIPPVRLKHDQ